MTPAVEPAAEADTPSAKPVEEETADISLQEQRRKARADAARDERQAQREKQARAEAERTMRAAQREAQRDDAMEAQRQAGNAQRQASWPACGRRPRRRQPECRHRYLRQTSSGYAERVRQRVRPEHCFQ
ncbi:hypothetical protein ACTMU2_40775 [Cupriavidus basilensis]